MENIHRTHHDVQHPDNLYFTRYLLCLLEIFAEAVQTVANATASTRRRLDPPLDSIVCSSLLVASLFLLL